MPPPPARPVTVLVIEDVRDTADSLAEFLRTGYGFDVRVATDGETGLKWAQADPPDAIVCDIGLPRLDGLQVARQVRDTVSPCPLLIAVTAYGGTFPQAAALGPFDHYLVKPADPFELAALIEPLSR
jgi:DNA-binding response OmpR family regulator